jgi:hypothetical protein
MYRPGTAGGGTSSLHRRQPDSDAVDYTQVSNILILKETEIACFWDKIKQNQ